MLTALARWYWGVHRLPFLDALLMILADALERWQTALLDHDSCAQHALLQAPDLPVEATAQDESLLAQLLAWVAEQRTPSPAWESPLQALLARTTQPFGSPFPYVVGQWAVACGYWGLLDDLSAHPKAPPMTLWHTLLWVRGARVLRQTWPEAVAAAARPNAPLVLDALFQRGWPAASGTTGRSWLAEAQPQHIAVAQAWGHRPTPGDVAHWVHRVTHHRLAWPVFEALCAGWHLTAPLQDPGVRGARFMHMVRHLPVAQWPDALAALQAQGQTPWASLALLAKDSWGMTNPWATLDWVLVQLINHPAETPAQRATLAAKVAALNLVHWVTQPRFQLYSQHRHNTYDPLALAGVLAFMHPHALSLASLQQAQRHLQDWQPRPLLDTLRLFGHQSRPQQPRSPVLHARGVAGFQAYWRTHYWGASSGNPIQNDARSDAWSPLARLIEVGLAAPADASTDARARAMVMDTAPLQPPWLLTLALSLSAVRPPGAAPWWEELEALARLPGMHWPNNPWCTVHLWEDAPARAHALMALQNPT